MKVKTLSEQVDPTCQTILRANGCRGFQCPFHGKAGLFLGWHSLPTVPADPEVSWPFLRRGRHLPTLQGARRLLYCLWLVSMLLRVISSLIDSNPCAASCCSPCSGKQNSNFPGAPGTFPQYNVPGFTLLPTLGSCDNLLQPVHGRHLHISTGGLSSCSGPHTRNVWMCIWDAVPGSHCPMGSIFKPSDLTGLCAEVSAPPASSWVRVQRSLHVGGI